MASISIFRGKPFSSHASRNRITRKKYVGIWFPQVACQSPLGSQRGTMMVRTYPIKSTKKNNVKAPLLVA